MFIRRSCSYVWLTINFFTQFVLATEPQNDSLLAHAEQVLLTEYQQILNTSLHQRTKPSEQFYHSFCEALSKNNTFNYPFLLLEGIGKVYSPDGRIRIYTWNIPVGLDDNLYYGVVQFYSKLDKRYKLAYLNDLIQVGEEKYKRSWDEALYYEIVETKHAGQRYYTLLGFDLATPLTNKKIVDIIAIDDFDELYFCRNLISYNGARTNRIVFEYNQQVIMNLRYHDDKKLIVFDHLSPSRPSLKGKYEFYGPDMSYDALKWEKGIWVHITNIDITN